MTDVVKVGDLVEFALIKSQLQNPGPFQPVRQTSTRSIGIVCKLHPNRFYSVKIMYDRQYYYSNIKDCKKINEK